MIAYTRKQIIRLLKIDFIRFCLVGGSGFILNLAILTLLASITSWPVFICQLISSEIALFSNFLLHHYWTYKRHKVHKTIPTLLLQFHASSWPAILGSAIMVSAAEYYLSLSHLFALMLSSVIVLLWNYAWSKYVIWRDVNSRDIEAVIK